MKKTVLLITSLLLATQSFAASLTESGNFTSNPRKTIYCYQYSGDTNNDTSLAVTGKNIEVFAYEQNGSAWKLLLNQKTGTSDQDQIEISNISKNSKKILLRMKYFGNTDSTYTLTASNTPVNGKLEKQASCLASNLGEL